MGWLNNSEKKKMQAIILGSSAQMVPVMAPMMAPIIAPIIIPIIEPVVKTIVNNTVIEKVTTIIKTEVENSIIVSNLPPVSPKLNQLWIPIPPSTQQQGNHPTI